MEEEQEKVVVVADVAAVVVAVAVLAARTKTTQLGISPRQTGTNFPMRSATRFAKKEIRKESPAVPTSERFHR